MIHKRSPFLTPLFMCQNFIFYHDSIAKSIIAHHQIYCPTTTYYLEKENRNCGAHPSPPPPKYVPTFEEYEKANYRIKLFYCTKKKKKLQQDLNY